GGCPCPSAESTGVAPRCAPRRRQGSGGPVPAAVSASVGEVVLGEVVGVVGVVGGEGDRVGNAADRADVGSGAALQTVAERGTRRLGVDGELGEHLRVL